MNFLENLNLVSDRDVNSGEFPSNNNVNLLECYVNSRGFTDVPGYGFREIQRESRGYQVKRPDFS